MNRYGTCAAVATELLLGYHNFYDDRRLLKPEYLKKNYNDQTICPDPMTILENEYGTTDEFDSMVVENIPANSNLYKFLTGLRKILSDRTNELGLSVKLASIGAGIFPSNIANVLDNDIPVILGLQMYSFIPDHAVLCYGYQTLGGSGTIEDGNFGYIIDMGWSKNTTNVWVNMAWCLGYLYLNIKHEHTYSMPTGPYCEAVCTGCGHRKSEYPFDIVVENNEIKINGFSGDVSSLAIKTLTIPKKINDLPVTKIETEAFKNMTSLEEVKLPITLDYIGYGAFSGCSNLKFISLPFTGQRPASPLLRSSFGYIFGETSYYNSSPTIQNGRTYYIPDSLVTVELTDITEVKSYAFENCNNVETVVLPYGVEHILSSAFMNCSKLKNINLPKSLTHINNNAFSGCTHLSTVLLPYCIEYIGSNVFHSSTKIEWVYNESYSPTSLGILNQLDKIYIRKNISSNRIAALNGCDLSEVTIDFNVTYIPNGFFSGCLFDKFNWNYNPQLNKDAIKYCVTNVYLPGQITEIPDNTFENFINLKSVDFQKTITSIGSHAFDNCSSLRNIVIPEAVTSIGSYAFKNCTSLTCVSLERINGPIACIGDYVLDGCPANCIFKVNPNRFFDYWNDSNWLQYRNQIRMNYGLKVISGTPYNYNVFIRSDTKSVYRLSSSLTELLNISVVSDNDFIMKLYNNSYQLVSQSDDYIFHRLNGEDYYLEIAPLNDSNISISLQITQITDVPIVRLHDGTNNIFNNFYPLTLSNYENKLSYSCFETGFYKFEINSIRSDNIAPQYPANTLRIFSDIDMVNVIEKYSITSEHDLAINRAGEKYLYVYLEKDHKYYLDIHISSLNYSVFQLSVNRCDEHNINYLDNILISSFSELFSCNATEYFKKISIDIDCKVMFENYVSGVNTVKGYILKLLDDGTYSVICYKDFSNSYSDNRTIILRSGTYYFGYINNVSQRDVSFAMNRIVEDLGGINPLVVDPDNPNYFVGSEVIDNDGDYYDTTIHSGFTRNIYIIDNTYTVPFYAYEYIWIATNDYLTIYNDGEVFAEYVEDAVQVTIYAVLYVDPGVVFDITFTIIPYTIS